MRIKLLGAFLLMVLAWPDAASAQETTNERAVRALWQQFEAAYNAGDAAAIGALFTPTADRVNGSGPLITGRAAIQQGYAQLLARRAADSTARPFHPRITVRIIQRNVAILDGEWTSLRNGREAAGRFVLIAVKTGERWLFEAGRAWEN